MKEDKEYSTRPAQGNQFERKVADNRTQRHEREKMYHKIIINR